MGADKTKATQAPSAGTANEAQAKREAAEMCRRVLDKEAEHIHFAGLEVRRLAPGEGVTSAREAYFLSPAMAEAIIGQHRMLARKLLELAQKQPSVFKADAENKHVLIACGHGLQLLDILHGDE